MVRILRCEIFRACCGCWVLWYKNTAFLKKFWISPWILCWSFMWRLLLQRQPPVGPVISGASGQGRTQIFGNDKSQRVHKSLGSFPNVLHSWHRNWCGCSSSISIWWWILDKGVEWKGRERRGWVNERKEGEGGVCPRKCCTSSLWPLL